MLSVFKKRWVWIVVVFMVINIAGLLKIISILEYKEGIRSKPIACFASSLMGNIRQIFWPMKKIVENIVSGEFRVSNIEPNMYDASPSIKVELTEEVDLDKIKGYIDISPKTDFYVEDY